MGNKLKVNVSPDVLALEIGERNRWVAGNMSGAPTNGIQGMNFGILPEEFRELMSTAVYAIYSYQTPIVAELADGRWVVPAAKYSNTTGKHLTKVGESLGIVGIRFSIIPAKD